MRDAGFFQQRIRRCFNPLFQLSHKFVSAQTRGDRFEKLYDSNTGAAV